MQVQLLFCLITYCLCILFFTRSYCFAHKPLVFFIFFDVVLVAAVVVFKKSPLAINHMH